MPQHKDIDQLFATGSYNICSTGIKWHIVGSGSANDLVTQFTALSSEQKARLCDDAIHQIVHAIRLISSVVLFQSASSGSISEEKSMESERRARPKVMTGLPLKWKKKNLARVCQLNCSSSSKDCGRILKMNGGNYHLWPEKLDEKNQRLVKGKDQSFKSENKRKDFKIQTMNQMFERLRGKNQKVAKELLGNEIKNMRRIKQSTFSDVMKHVNQKKLLFKTCFKCYR